MKRFIAMLLAAVMLVSLFPTAAFAAEDCIVTTTSDNGKGATIAATTGGGKYTTGESVTVSTTPVDGYTFVGWFEKGSSYSGTPLERSVRYTFKVSGDVELVAVYQASGRGSATLTVIGSSFTISVEEDAQYGYYQQKVDVGTDITLTSTDGAFQYWKNGEGKIMSHDKGYTFTFIRDLTLQAMSSANVGSGSAMVVFATEFDQVLSSKTYSASTDPAKIVFPANAYRPGQTLIGWDHSPEEIIAEIKGGSKYIVVKPEFVPDGQYTVEMQYNGKSLTLTDEQKYRDSGTDVAFKAMDKFGGSDFSYWTLNGEIISYGTNVSFFIFEDSVLNAVYEGARTGEVVTKMGTPFYEEGVIHVPSFRLVTSDYAVTNAGVLFAEDTVFGKDLNTAEQYFNMEPGNPYLSSIKVREVNAGGKGTIINNAEYLHNKTTPNPFVLYYRSFVTYRPVGGSEVTTIYSDILTVPYPQEGPAETYVAKVGANQYKTFDDAVKAAGSTGIIELLANAGEYTMVAGQKLQVKKGEFTVELKAPEGYGVEAGDPDDGVVTYTVVKYAAKVDEQGYETFAAAVEAAAGTKAIVLLENVGEYALSVDQTLKIKPNGFAIDPQAPEGYVVDASEPEDGVITYTVYLRFEKYVEELTNAGKVTIGDLPEKDERRNVSNAFEGVSTVGVKGITVDESGNVTLNNGFEYTLDDANAANSHYADWTADFVVSFNRDVKDGEVVLLGNYGTYGWVPLPIGETAANTPVKLIESMDLGDVKVNYAFLAGTVNDFLCGATYSGSNEMIMTVQLVVYEDNEEATPHTVGEAQTYTFPETTFEDYAAMLISKGDFTIENNAYVAENALAGLETLDPAEYGYEGFEFDTNPAHMKGLQKNDGGSYTLLSGREYKINDENAADTPYAYWSADIAVSFDKYVKAGEVILFGKYNSAVYDDYDMAIPVPMDVPEGQSVRLIKTGFKLMGDEGGHIPYVELCRSVQDFLCGAVYTGTQALTMDVQLVVYDEEGAEHLFGEKQTYIFPETAFDDYAAMLINKGDFVLKEQPYAGDKALDALKTLDPTAFGFDEITFDTNPDHMKGLQKQQDGSYTLLTGREYKVTDENAANTPYANWSVDIAVTFNKNVKAGEVILFGKYDSPLYSSYDMAIPVPVDIPAGEPVRLMKTAFTLMGAESGYIPYWECCESVQDLLCGAVYTGTQELTMTAQLMVYETDETGKEVGDPHLVGAAQTYTFPATDFDDYVEQLIADGDYTVAPAPDTELTADDLPDGMELEKVKGLTVKGNQVTLDSATKYSLTDDKAADCAYANWTADFEVSFNKNVAANTVILLGNYGDYGWVPLTMGAATANTPVNLIETLASQFPEGGLGGFKITYQYLAASVKDFLCGAVYIGQGELTMSVQLVVTDETDTKHYVGDPVTYLFTSFESYIADGNKYAVEKSPETEAPVEVISNTLPTGTDLSKVKGIKAADNGGYALDSAAKYTVNDDKASDCDYADWDVDFIVKFSKDVNAGDVTLMGYYEGAGWVAVPMTAASKNQEIKLLETLGSALGFGGFTVDYQFLAENVPEFLCGAVYIGEGELTMSVQLVAFDEEGARHPVGNPVKYIFKDFASHIDDLKERKNEKGEYIVAIGDLSELDKEAINITQSLDNNIMTDVKITVSEDGKITGETPHGKQIDELQGVTVKKNEKTGNFEIELDSGRCYVLNEDPTEEAEAYNNWHVDYEVWFESDVKAEELILMGNYESYGVGWIPFWNPEDVAGGNENVKRLISSYGAQMIGLTDPDNAFVTYKTLYTDIQQFACGAAYTGKDKLVMHVDLYAYETDEAGNETGVKHLVDAHTYTFGGNINKHVEELIKNEEGYIGVIKEETDKDVSGIIDGEFSEYTDVELTLGELKEMNGVTVDEEGNVSLDNGREYSVHDPKGNTSAYANWNIDFVVSFNKPISSYAGYKAGTGDTVILLGNYGGYGWIPISLPAMQKDQTVALLESAEKTINYGELNTTVEKFLCGALYTGKDELTMTVNLVAHGEDENGNPTDYVLDSYQYKFEATAPALSFTRALPENVTTIGNDVNTQLNVSELFRPETEGAEIEASKVEIKVEAETPALAPKRMMAKSLSAGQSDAETPASWADLKLDLSGKTGKYKITLLYDGKAVSKPIVINVVEAKNVKDADDIPASGAYVLLANIEAPENGDFEVSAAVYGNEYKIDITNAKSVTLEGASLNNVSFTGGNTITASGECIIPDGTIPNGVKVELEPGAIIKNDDEYVAPELNWTALGEGFTVDAKAGTVSFAKGTAFNAETLIPTGYEKKTEITGTVDTEAGDYALIYTITDGTHVTQYAVTVTVTVTYVAQIGEQGYETFDAALSAATSGDTVLLLADLADISATKPVTLPTGVILDGNNHKISGVSGIYVPAAGATIQNVVFENIHNTAPVSESDIKYYGWEAGKTGTQSAIYANGLTGTLSVTGCSFDNVDWDAIQVTAKSNSTINITNNVFTHTDAESTQIRYIHIEEADGNSFPAANVNINGNKFYKTKNTSDTAITTIGVWDIAPNGLNLTGNYIEYEGDVLYTDAQVKKGLGLSYIEKLFPAVGNDNEALNYVTLAGNVAYLNAATAPGIEGHEGVYLTFAEAIEAEDTDVELLKNVVAENVVIPEGVTLKIDSDEYVLTGSFTNNGTLNLWYGDGECEVTVTNNGKVIMDCDAAAGYTVSGGTVEITDGEVYDLSKITNADITISGGTFTTEPDEALIKDFYIVEEDDDLYTVRKMTKEEAAAAAVAYVGNEYNPTYLKTLENNKEARTYLLKDVENGKAVWVESTYNYGGLDTNGHSFTGSIDMGTKNYVILYGDSFVLTDVTGKKLQLGPWNEASEVTIQNGTLPELVVQSLSKCTIEGGKYDSIIVYTRYANNQAAEPQQVGELTIKGGLFKSNDITHTIQNHEPGSETKHLSDYVPAEGYKIVALKEGDEGYADGYRYAVVECTYVAQIDDQGYETFTDAVTAAKGTETIELLDNIGDYTMADNSTLIVKLNGKKLNVNVSESFVLVTEENEGVTTYQSLPAVAKMGEEKFATVEAAVEAYNAAPAGDYTVTVLNGTHEVSPMTVKQAVGKTLTVTAETAKGATLKLKEEGNVFNIWGASGYGTGATKFENLVIDITVNGQNKAIHALNQTECGTTSARYASDVTMDNCKIIGKLENGDDTVMDSGAATDPVAFALLNSETDDVARIVNMYCGYKSNIADYAIKIDNCQFKGEVWHILNNQVAGTPNIVTNCTAENLTSDYAIRVKGGTLTLTGNSFTTNCEDASYSVIVVRNAVGTIIADENNVFTTKEGTTAIPELIAETAVTVKVDDKVVNNAAAGYSGKLIPDAVAKVGETKYKTFAEAVTAANGTATIELLADASYTMSVGETLKVKLGGKTLDLSAPEGYGIDSNVADDVMTYTLYLDIDSVDDLLAFASMVNNDLKNFAGETVKLSADLDLAGVEWEPIGAFNASDCGGDPSFNGTFDGQNKTISNLLIGEAYANENGVGFFASNAVYDDIVIKNLTIDGATVYGNKWVGVISGYMNGASVTGCTVKNATVYSSAYRAGAIVGFAANDAIINGNSAENVTINVTKTVSEPNNICVGTYMGNNAEANLGTNTATNSSVVIPAALTGYTVDTANKLSAVYSDSTTKPVTDTELAAMAGKVLVQSGDVLTVSDKTLAQVLSSATDGMTIYLAYGDYIPGPAGSSVRVSIIGLCDSDGAKTAYLQLYNSNGGETKSYSYSNLSLTVKNLNLVGQDEDANGDARNGAGFVYPDSLYVENCVFSKSQCIWNNGKQYTIKDSTFNCSNLGSKYAMWTRGNGTWSFDNCIFNTNGKALKIYASRGAVNVKDCTFNVTEQAATKAAVQVDCGNVTVTITNCKGNNHAGGLFACNNSTSTVIVDGEQLWPVAPAPTFVQALPEQVDTLGNSGAQITAGDLFKLEEGTVENPEDVTVQVEQDNNTEGDSATPEDMTEKVETKKGEPEQALPMVRKSVSAAKGGEKAASWANAAVDLSGFTGRVKITLLYDGKPVSKPIVINVVEAKNVKEADDIPESGDYVLLTNITVPENTSNFNVKAAIHGNSYQLDISNAQTVTLENANLSNVTVKGGENTSISLSGTTLSNVEIENAKSVSVSGECVIPEGTLPTEVQVEVEPGTVIKEDPAEEEPTVIYEAPALNWEALGAGFTVDAEKLTVSFNEGTAFDAACLVPDGYSDKTQITGTVGTEPGEYSVTYTISDTVDGRTYVTKYDVTVTVVEIIPTFVTKFVNSASYLYRVGNANNVALDSLFSAEGKVRANKVSVEVTNIAGNAAGTFTASSTDWTAGTLKFTGTGVVTVALNYGDETKLNLNLEVVDATNVTTYSELKNKNSVLLNDITMSSGGIYDLNNASLYGNGFTLDARNAAHEIPNNAYESTNGAVRISNATIDNVSIVGKPYTDYTGTAKTEWNFACVLVNGDSVIANSYISNCGAPVRARGGAKLLLKNTTLKGGTFCNLDIRSGAKVTADGLTTINQVNMNDAAENGNTYVGLGIVIYYEGISGNESITITGNGLTQYNNVAKNQSGNAVSMAGMAWNSVFGINSKFRYSDGTTEWVNTGILILSRDVSKENISAISGYDWENVSLLGQSGYAYIPLAKTPTSSEEDFDPNAQYPVAPTATFELPTAAGKKNYLAKTEDSKNYCYYDSAQGAILIGFEKGDSFSFDPRILTVTKNGASITPVVTMGGQTYTDSIPFTEGGEYTITYTYTDPYNYGAGGAAADPVTYTKTLDIIAVAADKTLEPATFDFNGKGYKVANGNNNVTYVMPDIDDSAVDGLNYVKKTVGGQTVYYPVVCVRSGSPSTTTSINGSALGKSATNTALVMVFDGIVTITDNGKVYNSSNTNMADGKLSAVESGLKSALVWQSSNSYDTEPDVVNNKQCYKSASVQGVNRTQTGYDIEYIYRDDAGNEYHYFVKYVFPAKGTGTNAYYQANATFTVTVSCGAYGTVDNTTIKGVKYGTALTSDLNKLMNGTKVIATATPNERYAASWSGLTSSVTKDTTVTLKFVKDCTLTINCGEGGTVNTQTVTGVAEGAKLTVDGNKLLVNDAVVATATPNANYLTQWSNVPSTVSDDTTVNLSFIPPVTVTINCGEGGTVNKTSIPVVYNSKLTVDGNNLKVGSTVIATATPNEGAAAKWVDVPTSALTADTSISVEFVAPITITISAGSNGKVDKTSYTGAPGLKLTTDGAKLKYGDTVIATATANDGYNVGSWSGNDLNKVLTANTSVNISFSKQSSSCVAKGTLITMADGSQKKIEDLAANDMILSFNHETGVYEAMPIFMVVNHGTANYTVMNLKFEDGTNLEIIESHGLFDFNLNQYVDIREDNYSAYRDHSFAQYAGNGTTRTVKLIDVEVYSKETDMMAVFSFADLNAITNGFVSYDTKLYGTYNYFAYDGNMKYVESAKEQDIMNLGTYDYDYWSAYISRNIYEAFNFKYFKIAVEKGLCTENAVVGYIMWLRELIAEGCVPIFNEDAAFIDSLVDTNEDAIADEEEPVEEEPIEEPVEEIVEEPVEEEPVEEIVEEPVEEDPVEEIVEEPVEEEPIEEIVEEPVEEIVEEFADEEPVEEPVEELANEDPVEEIVEEIVDEEPVEEIIEELVEEPVEA